METYWIEGVQVAARELGAEIASNGQRDDARVSLMVASGLLHDGTLGGVAWIETNADPVALAWCVPSSPHLDLCDMGWELFDACDPWLYGPDAQQWLLDAVQHVLGIEI